MGTSFVSACVKSTLCLIALLILPAASQAATTRWTGSAEITYQFGGFPEFRYMSGYFDVDTDLDVVTDFRFLITRDSALPSVPMRTYVFTAADSFASLSIDGLFVLQSPLIGLPGSLDFGFMGTNFFSPFDVEAYGHFTETRGSEVHHWFDVQFAGATVTTPIPEPGTYALMLAGLAGLGVMARRRKLNAA